MKLKSISTIILYLTAISPAVLAGTGGEMTGYLFSYFEGSGDKTLQEHLRFALSNDGINWYALNSNNPIVKSDSISESGGIRDPHILRGEDGNTFYIVATDMHTAKHGWGANPGIVMMKSPNLTDWNASHINLSETYPENFGDAYWVWAPQTIYDPKVKKYMVYFTLRRQDKSKGLVTYYAYANDDFTGFESEPEVLFEARYGSIDNDIILHNGKYHLFYKGNTKDKDGNEIKNGIQQATSTALHGKWKEDFKYLDSYASTTPVEGSSIFRLNDGSAYVLMYDLYTSGRYEYQTTRDLKNFSEPKPLRTDFKPRHGSVVSLNDDELTRLQEKWGYVLRHDFVSDGNPAIRHKHTADPAAIVKNDTLWLFTGHDEPGNKSGYHMNDWLLFSTTDLKHWTEYPSPLKVTDFSWAPAGNAFAGHVAEKNGKYYWYVSTNWKGIGVAVADSITGPYADALGRQLLTNDDCFDSTHGWACIDPAIFIDDDGTPYIFWGNRHCYMAKLKDNMVEIDGNVKRVDLDGKHPFTEAPWVWKHDGRYYLAYAAEWPEKIAYAIADNINGPYKPMGIISEIAGNSNTTHPAIVKFRDQWLFISHNGGLPGGGSGSRSVIIEPMEYNHDGTIRKIHPSSEGITITN